MMRPISRFAKAWLVPGSMSFLFLGLAVGVAWLYGPASVARWGRLWLTVLGLLYLILSLPAVSNRLLWSLQGDATSIRDADDARGADVIVVLGNGGVSYSDGSRGIHQFMRRTAFCVLEALRLEALLQPRLFIASGGPPDGGDLRWPEAKTMERELVWHGVEAERVVVETQSRTTEDQVRNVATLLKGRGITRFVMVTTPAHSARALALFADEQLEAIPSVAEGLQYHPPSGGVRDWIPSAVALRGSESAMYEYLAMAAERLKPAGRS